MRFFNLRPPSFSSLSPPSLFSFLCLLSFWHLLFGTYLLCYRYRPRINHFDDMYLVPGILGCFIAFLRWLYAPLLCCTLTHTVPYQIVLQFFVPFRDRTFLLLFFVGSFSCAAVHCFAISLCTIRFQYARSGFSFHNIFLCGVFQIFVVCCSSANEPFSG